MQTFHFSNPSVLPIEAITILGVSVKDEGSIGRFGTGLKYTIAGILRLGEEISIETGGKKYYFSSRRTYVKGKLFEVVHMTVMEPGLPDVEADLGFTTELGKHWEPWMYVRELWSNMKDEGGTHDWGLGEEPSSSQTRIMVKGPLLAEAYRKLPSFILESAPDYIHSGVVAIHGRPSSMEREVFYQGIKVFEASKPLLHRYNLQGNVPLTEDRILAYPEAHLNARAAVGILHSRNKGWIKELLTLGENSPFYESSFHLNGEMFDDFSLEILKELYDTAPVSLSSTAHEVAYHKYKPDDSKMTFDLSPVEREKFSRALSFIQKLGCTKDVEWNFVDPEDHKAFGFVRDDKIYICRRAFHNGTSFLAQTMMEEYIHLVYEERDYSSSMQDRLFAMIISLGEEVHGVL